MLSVPDITEPPAQIDLSRADRRIRDTADAYVRELAELDPLVATYLGLAVGQDRLPDFSPAGAEALDDLRRSALTRLTQAEGAADTAGGLANADERRCARLLRERLRAELAVSELGEHLRSVSNFLAPPLRVRDTFLLMPSVTAEDWESIANRIGCVPDALAGYQASLAEGASRGLYAAPRLIKSLADQLASWQSNGTGWFAGFAAAPDGPRALRADLDAVGPRADAAVARLRNWMVSDYLPGAAGTPDGVGEERYRVGVRHWNGASLDLAQTYEWGWSQYRQITAEMIAEADRILPGSTVAEAMRHVEEHGEVIDGVEEVRVRLQQLMDEAMANLDGTHFDLADPVKVVKARIAPPGSAAAPYYTDPSQDFSRPGQTWLPTLGQTRFPMWHLISTWYHEGVPGHHLQLAQWRYLAKQLSEYQTSVGDVSACTEGWGLYAERLMDELGYLEAPGARLGYLDAQLMRAIRVILDIGMHLELPAAADSPMFAGQRWTPELAADFFVAHNGRGREFGESEVVRYLGIPGQAISYKVGERAWLAGREAARAARGDSFDLKSWHMAALSLGSLGLDDLADELALL
jgi:uncharacterized protein (DUF885 family)